MSDEQTSAAGPDAPTDLPKRSWIAVLKRVFGQPKDTRKLDDDQTAAAEKTASIRGARS